MKRSELKTIIRECIEEVTLQEADKDHLNRVMSKEDVKASKSVESSVNGQKNVSVKVKIIGFRMGKPWTAMVATEVEALAVAYAYRNSKAKIEKAGGNVGNVWLVVVG